MKITTMFRLAGSFIATFNATILWFDVAKWPPGAYFALTVGLIFLLTPQLVLKSLER